MFSNGKDMFNQLSHIWYPTYRISLQKNPSTCCCNRPKKTVICRMCGSKFMVPESNMRCVCPAHPND
ncbi:hypothetical protein J6590_015200 [Homalodisca vitripennis]|nr:hypothetical protein J6590_015200 [Homalodisca vitripennis]